MRTHLACGGTQTVKNLHSRTIQLVRASAQAEAVKRIQPMLDEDEQTVLRHGRNAKPKSVPKSAPWQSMLRDRTRGAVRLAVPQGTL